MDPSRNDAAKPESRAEELSRLTSQPQMGLVRDFLGFLRTNKKWWLAPIIVVLLLLGLLVILAGTAASPLLYPL
jgi:hypothetical protein